MDSRMALPLNDEHLSPHMRVVPELLLLRHDQGAGTLLEAEGADLTLRLTTEVLLDVPIKRRQAEWERIWSIREFGDRLWPNGWDRDRDKAPLVATIYRIDLFRFPTEGDGGPWERKLFTIPDLPDISVSLDAFFALIVQPPATEGWGGLVHLPTIRALGQISDCAYRAGLGLAKMWAEVPENRSATFIQPTRPRVLRNERGLLIDSRGESILNADGVPVTDLMDDRIVFLDEFDRPTSMDDAARERNPEADLYPSLSDDELALLCYPTATGEGNRGRRATLARRIKPTLLALQERGFCKIEEVPQGGATFWRILPPEGWGANYGN